jgi:hypothetical protein
MENWKTVEGYEMYEVSDLGRVRRAAPRETTKNGVTNVSYAWVGKLISLHPDRRGYTRVLLSTGPKQRSLLHVHRLVAKAFIPNPLNLPEVNHTGEKSDCRAIKLEWKSKAAHRLDKSLRNQEGDGVYYDKKAKKYCAHYSPEPYKKKHIGSFDTHKEAKAARDEKVKEKL